MGYANDAVMDMDECRELVGEVSLSADEQDHLGSVSYEELYLSMEEQASLDNARRKTFNRSNRAWR